MNNNTLPKTAEIGEMIALSNRAIMVWCGDQWHLLGGEYLSLNNYNRAISYLLDAWGQETSILTQDLSSILDESEKPKQYIDAFIYHCEYANNLISKFIS
jgi:hypothetical protein